jgi:hypothetical protein
LTSINGEWESKMNAVKKDFSLTQRTSNILMLNSTKIWDEYDKLKADFVEFVELNEKLISALTMPG